MYSNPKLITEQMDIIEDAIKNLKNVLKNK